MAELFLGGRVDPATHERTGDDVRIGTDSLTTHGVIVGMTGSGKTGLGVVLIEEVLRAGSAGAAHRPEGRPHQPLPHVPGTASRRLPAVDRRRPGQGGRGVARRVRRPAVAAVDRGPGRLGNRSGRHRRAAGVDGLHDLHAGLAVGCADQHRRLAPGAGRHERRRDRRRRDRGLRLGTARPRRHRGRSAVEPRAHPALEPHRSFVAGQGTHSTCRRWWG